MWNKNHFVGFQKQNEGRQWVHQTQTEVLHHRNELSYPHQLWRTAVLHISHHYILLLGLYVRGSWPQISTVVHDLIALIKRSYHRWYSIQLATGWVSDQGLHASLSWLFSFYIHTGYACHHNYQCWSWSQVFIICYRLVSAHRPRRHSWVFTSQDHNCQLA